MSASSVWQPLRQPEFRALWGGSLAVHLANWMQQVAAASMMATLTQAPMMTALVQTAASLPAVLLSLPAGAMADRIDRRRWLMFTQSLILLGALATVTVTAANLLTPWGLFGLTLLLGTGFALHAPAAQAVIGDVVTRADLPMALALGGVSYNISRVLGPAIAGSLIATRGGAAVYVAVALCCLAMLAFLKGWGGVPRRDTELPQSLWAAVLQGMRHAQQTPAFRGQLTHVLVFIACGSATWALLPVLVRDTYPLVHGGYGLLLGAFGVGGVLGVFLLQPVRSRWPAHRVVALSALGFAPVPALLAWPVPLEAALLVVVWGGAAWLCGASTLYTALQTTLPDWVRSRGIAIYNLVYFGAMAGGSAGWGALTVPLGTRPVLLIASATALLTAAWHARVPLDDGTGR